MRILMRNNPFLGSETSELLQEGECLRILALLTGERDLNCFSVYERFCILSDSLDLLDANDVKSKLLGALKADVGIAVPADALKFPDFRKNLWRAVFGDRGAYEKLRCSGYNGSESTRYAMKTGEMISCDSAVHVYHFLKHFDGDMRDAITELSKKISVFADFSISDYVRPDEYHANLAYAAVKNGIAPTSSEYAVLLTWIICKLLLRQNTKIFLKIDRNTDFLQDFSDLLMRRKISASFTVVCDGIPENCIEKMFEIAVTFVDVEIRFAFSNEVNAAQMRRLLPSDRVLTISNK